ncbi:amidohydrolase family protein [Haliea sp. E17]|uniref:amidohydrolase family protein n=1 Tax=Haliea sp. E17 TaxID=3401576 RepID=UPI003AAD9443
MLRSAMPAGLLCAALACAAPGAQAAEVVLTEGTNLAASVHPPSGDAIIALQGRLYRQSPGDTDARPITGWLEDAWEPELAPDGKSLVYTGYRDGSWDIWRLALADGAQPQRLTDTLFDDREPVWLPDGQSILFSSDRSGNYDIWQLRLADGELVRLTDDPADEFAPAPSPDGAAFGWMAAVGREQEIRTRALVGDGAPQAVYRTRSKLSGLRWHPAGGQLSFRSLDRDADGNATSALRLLSLADGGEEILSPPGADVFPFRATWLDADSALYTSDGAIRTWRRGAAPVARPFRVSFDIPARDYPRKQRDFDSPAPLPVLGISHPVLSPDGTEVAFTALGDLWRWNPGSGALVQVTDDPAADQMAAWSDDGRSLAWVSDRGGRYRIYLQDLASGEREVLPVEKHSLSFPSWSPDGRKLAFFTDVPDNPLLHVVGQLTVYDRDSGALTTHSAPMPPQPIAWSADGDKLITTRLEPYSQRYREGLYVLAVVDLLSGTTTDITPVPHRSIAHASYAAAGMAAFSEDGALYGLPLDAALAAAGPVRLLYDGLADSPHWSNGGKYLVFQAGNRLLRLTAASGAVEDISPALTWQRDLPQEEWLLRAGKLFDGTGAGYRENVDIHVRGNRIAAVYPAGTRADLPVVDASDKVVIPGLFESHAHIGDHNHSESQGRAWLAYGITSIRDPGSNPYLANERKEAWSSGRRIGPRTFITGHNIDGRRVYYAVVEGITSDEHLERALQRSQLLDVDFIKTYVRLPDRQQQRVVEFAHAMGVPVTSHELLPAAVYGVDAIEHFTGTSRRGYTTKISELGRSYQDVVEVLSVSGMGVVPTMVVPGVVLTFTEQDDIYSTRQFDAFYGPPMKQTYQDFMGFFGPGSEGYVDAYGELLSKLIARGALVGTGTDSPFTPFGTGLHAELRLYQREGIPPAKILQAATLQSARIAGADADLGSIEAGKLADMVVLDGDPLADISDSDNVVMTVKNGRRYALEDLLDYRE